MTPVTFRPATEADHPPMAALSVIAYPDPSLDRAARAARYRTLQAFRPGAWMIAERHGRHVGQYVSIHFDGHLGGQSARVCGLGSVAVQPQERRRGVAGAIVRDHLRYAVDHEFAWGLLYPFSPAFYARFGWAPAAARVRHRFRPGELPRFEERLDVERLSLDDRATCAAVQRCYDRFAVITNGSLSRSADYLGWCFRGDHYLVIGLGGDTPGELSGYLIAELHAPTARPQLLRVIELVALDAVAERALYGFLAAQGDQVDAIEIDRPPGDPLPALLDRGLAFREGPEMPEEHHPTATVYSGAMARVVDLRRALVGRGYPRAASARVAFALVDPEQPANQTVLTLTVEEGRPTIATGRAAATPLISGPVGAVSQLLCGALALDQAIRFQRLALDGAAVDQLAQVTALLALPPPYPLMIF